MTAGNGFDATNAEPVLFSALLKPHRSLNRTGFVLVMAFLSAISFATGIAFKINFGRARAREEITVTPSELRVRRISHRGHRVEWVLNPLWVRLDEVTHQEFGTERIYLISRGRRVSVGSFLGPDEKASFAKALRAGLVAARRGPTYNPVT